MVRSLAHLSPLNPGRYTEKVDVWSVGIVFYEMLTDLVATIATFSQLKVEPDLHALCVGESVVNDAVAVVMYSAAAGFVRDEHDVGGADVLGQCARFALVCVASVVLGLVGALGCALALKHARLPPVAQVSAMLLCAYGTYLVCEVVDQSGIVGALVCGFGMKK